MDGDGEAGADAAALGQRIRQLRGTTSQDTLGRRIGFDRTRISKAENGELPSADLCKALDNHWRTGGELTAWQARLDEVGDSARREDATDRRAFGGLTLATILTSAGEASDAMATADPPPLTLEEMEAEVEAIADAVYDVPREVMLHRAATRWHETYVLLGRPVSGKVRFRLLLLAGGFACQAAHLGRSIDNAAVVRRFGTLAGQYAAESGDPLLAGRLACLRSVNVFERGEYAKAADIAAQGRSLAHPGQHARLAAYEAKAHAAAGRDTAARDALADMRAQSRVATRWTDGDQVIFTAVTLAHLRDWAPAADLAEQYVVGGDNDRQGVGWAHVTTGRCLLATDRPDPAGAAHAGIVALGATVGPDMSVLRRTAGLHAELSRRWPDVAEVGQLGAALTAARATLPGRSVSA